MRIYYLLLMMLLMFSCETPTQQSGTTTKVEQPTTTNPQQPDTVQPPVTNHKVKLGVTYGNQIDHHIASADVPDYGRLFYYKEKDKPHGIPFKDYDFVPLVDLKMPQGVSWDSTMAENAFRIQAASKIFTVLSVSLEEVMDLNHNWHPFPFKDTPYAEYGDNEQQVTEVVYDYMTKWLITNGERVEILELGNEPWGYERWQWRVIERASIMAYNDYDGPKPKLASAAVPVGQGSDGDLTTFFNMELIEDYDIITAHFYPIEGGKFLLDKEAMMASMKTQLAILLDFHKKYAPHTDIYITETGIPSKVYIKESDSYIYLDETWFYSWLFEYCANYDPIKVIYAYTYKEIPTPPFDNMHMVDSTFTNTPTFDYLLTNYN